METLYATLRCIVSIFRSWKAARRISGTCALPQKMFAKQNQINSSFSHNAHDNAQSKDNIKKITMNETTCRKLHISIKVNSLNCFWSLSLLHLEELVFPCCLSFPNDESERKRLGYFKKTKQISPIAIDIP